MISDPIAWLSWFLLLLCFLVLAFVASRQGGLRGHSPIWWYALGFGVFFTFAPLQILITGELFNAVFSGDSFTRMAFASASLAIGFTCGWFLVRPRIRGGGRNRVTGPFLALGWRTRALALALVGATPLFLVLSGRGADPEWFNVNAFWLAAIPAAVLVLYMGLESHGFARGVISKFVFAVLLVTYTAAVWALEARYRLLFLLLPMWTLRSAQKGGQTLARSLTVMSVAGLVLALVGRIRGGGVPVWTAIQRGAGLLSLSLADLYRALFLTGDLDAFENGMHVMALVPAHVPLLGGSTFLSVLYNPIPRALWPGKPAPAITQVLTETGVGRGLVTSNFAVGLPAEAYGNFWWFGPVLVGVLMGTVSRHLWDRRIEHGLDREYWIRLGLWNAYLFLVLRGSFHAMTVYYLSVWVWLELSRRALAALKRAGSPPRRALSSYPMGCASAEEQTQTWRGCE